MTLGSVKLMLIFGGTAKTFRRVMALSILSFWRLKSFATNSAFQRLGVFYVKGKHVMLLPLRERYTGLLYDMG